MAEIILQASTLNKNYDIAPVIVDRDSYDESKTVLMDVVPHEGYVVDAKNFYSGLFSSKILATSYVNTQQEIDFDNRVRIQVLLQNELLKKGVNNVVVSVPVNGTTEIPNTTMTFTDKTTDSENMQVINKTGNVLKSSSTVENNTREDVYVTKGRRNETGVLLEKTFEADSGYYFKQPPVWSMTSSRKKNFIIKSKESRDERKRLIKKVYTLSYKFPDEKNIAPSTDQITFQAHVDEIKNRITSTTPDKKEEHKIYSFNVLPSSGGKFSNQYFIVKGVPGTSFEILAQDQDKKMYDFSSGQFKEGGTMLKGVIPQGKPGKPGIYRGVMKRNNQTQVDVRMITSDPDVDKANQVVTQTVAASYTASIIADKTSITSLNVGTATITSDKILETGVATVPFSYNITPADDKVLVLNREPLFDLTKDYKAWSTATDNTDETDKSHAGTVIDDNIIEMDFDITSGKASDDKRGAVFTIDITMIPVGEPLEATSDLTDLGILGYSAYKIVGEINVSDIGEENLVIEMMLNNFFSEHTPS